MGVRVRYCDGPVTMLGVYMPHTQWDSLQIHSHPEQDKAFTKAEWMNLDRDL